MEIFCEILRFKLQFYAMDIDGNGDSMQGGAVADFLEEVANSKSEETSMDLENVATGSGNGGNVIPGIMITPPLPLQCLRRHRSLI